MEFDIFVTFLAGVACVVGAVASCMAIHFREERDKYKSRCEERNDYNDAVERKIAKLGALITAGWSVIEIDNNLERWVLKAPDEPGRRRMFTEACERYAELEKIRRLNLPTQWTGSEEQVAFLRANNPDIPLKVIDGQTGEISDIDALAGVEIEEPEPNVVPFSGRSYLWQEEEGGDGDAA